MTLTNKLQIVSETLFDARELLSIVKTSPQTAQPLRIVYIKLTEAIQHLDQFTEKAL